MPKVRIDTIEDPFGTVIEIEGRDVAKYVETAHLHLQAAELPKLHLTVPAYSLGVAGRTGVDVCVGGVTVTPEDVDAMEAAGLVELAAMCRALLGIEEAG